MPKGNVSGTPSDALLSADDFGWSRPERGSVKGWQRADINSADPPPKKRSDQLDYSGPADVKAQVRGGDDETLCVALVLTLMSLIKMPSCP